ncbi:hypothetical protein KIN20_009177 [Parelaphostrongylus tenuis]|uniref:Uncharacterized protein n=1 Tax=Parelaphostrongylus tenuis TaxID=148309 RepID=A0AAD5MXG8_PARTN|nr:hypothetical protein KIN20_009177 [Parelaphostrongylus tenuis]
MALSSPAFGYAASIPNVHQADIFFQPSPVPPSYGLASQDLPNTTTGDLTKAIFVSNLAQCAPEHTVCSLDQSCVIGTSLHEEPLEEGRFGPIGSVIPPGRSLEETTSLCQQFCRNS